MEERIKRVQAEKEIKNPAIKWQTTFDAISDGISIVALDGKIIQADRGMEILTGKKGSGLIGKYCYDLIHEKDCMIEGCPLLKMQTSKKFEEAIFRLKDHWLKVRVYPLFDENRKIKQAVHIISNITDLKNREIELDNANRALRVLSKCNEVLVRAENENKFLYDICHAIIDIGGYLFAWVGYLKIDKIKKISPVAFSPESIKYLDNITIDLDDEKLKRGPTGLAFYNKSASVCRYIKGNSSFEPWQSEAMKYGFASSVALPLITEDKCFGTLNIYSGRIDDFDKNELNLLINLSEDISFGIAALRNMREKKRGDHFIQNILESVDEAIIVVDSKFKIKAANRAYSKLVKMAYGAITGKACYFVSHKLDKPCHYHNIDCPSLHTFKSGEPYSTIHTHKDDNGDEQILEIKSYPMKGGYDKYPCVIEIINDITEKRKLEQELRHAQKMEAIGTLAGGIAHDFNNILNAVQGFGNLIELNLPDEGQNREYLDEIFTATQRGANLVKSLMAFSRKQEIKLEPISINNIINSINNLLSRLIGANIDLKIKCSDSIFTVMADQSQMEQVIMNLVTNARDAMPKGGEILIETEPLKMDNKFIKENGFGKIGDYIQIRISDTGTGMNDEIIKKIYEPFFTTKEVDKGTGLGLSVVYGIIKQHKGFINVTSEINKGTEFNIYLPKWEDRSIQKENRQRKQLNTGVETILIAEDDPSSRKILINSLRHVGYSVIASADGEEAISLFQENKDQIELIILDLLMPKKNGREVYEAVLKITSNMKAIFITGHPSDIIDQKWIFEKGIHILYKPVSMEVLLANVRKVLDS